MRVPITPKRVYFLVGLVGLLSALGLLVLGGFAWASGGTTAALAPAAGLCAGIALLPALVFLWMYWRAQRHDVGLAQVGALLESYGEVSAATMAEKLGTTEDEAEQMMALSIREGHAHGRIDPKTRTFTSAKER